MEIEEMTLSEEDRLYCSRCSEKLGSDSRRRLCRECIRKEDKRAWQRKLRLANEGLCVKCGKREACIGKTGKAIRFCKKCMASEWEQRKKIRRRYTLQVYEAYGGAFCACCGEDEFCFLQLDHINNDGNEHRKTVAGGFEVIRWIRIHKFPPGFQVLCANCNFGKMRNHGVCPHKTQKKFKVVFEYTYL